MDRDAWYNALIGTLTSGTLDLAASPRRLAKAIADETSARLEAGEQSPVAEMQRMGYTQEADPSVAENNDYQAADNGKSDSFGYDYRGTADHIFEIMDSLPNAYQTLMQSGWKEISNDQQAKHGHHVLEESNTGMRIRFDVKKEGANGFSGIDHYHIYNPDATGNHNLYLDREGNPVNKKGKRSHILPKGE